MQNTCTYTLLAPSFLPWEIQVDNLLLYGHRLSCNQAANMAIGVRKQIASETPEKERIPAKHLGIHYPADLETDGWASMKRWFQTPQIVTQWMSMKMGMRTRMTRMRMTRIIIGWVLLGGARSAMLEGHVHGTRDVWVPIHKLWIDPVGSNVVVLLWSEGGKLKYTYVNNRASLTLAFEHSFLPQPICYTLHYDENLHVVFQYS